MNEDYVDFNLSMLLKDKGYPQSYDWNPAWHMNGSHPQMTFPECDGHPAEHEMSCIACTYEQAFKFIRLQFNIMVSIIPNYHHINCFYTFNANIHDFKKVHPFDLVRCISGSDTYEGAEKIALKILLTEII